jgi:hypothetical protein
LVGGLIDLPRAEYPPGLENWVILVRFWGGLENQEQDAHDVEGTNDRSISINPPPLFCSARVRKWRKAVVGLRKSISSADEKTLSQLRKPDGSCNKLKRWHPGCIPRLQRGPVERAFEAADLPRRRHRFSTALDRAAFAGSMIGFGHAKLFCSAGKFSKQLFAPGRSVT